MAEVNSVQGAKIVAGQKLLPAESHGRQRILIATLPATHAAYAVNDTIFLGRVPANTRFLTGAVISVGGSGTASSTVDIGTRNTVTQAVIDADGITVGADISAAGKIVADTGAFIAAAADVLTATEVDVYATVKGAVLAANQQMRFEIPYVTD
ncbi:hypothetical protein [Achromobacter mucicolens]|uniref:hypothetical protein n=1 Tax=Achromobacter mucicolens TaxID=1389922 RepID=UPI0039766907